MGTFLKIEHVTKKNIVVVDSLYSCTAVMFIWSIQGFCSHYLRLRQGNLLFLKAEKDFLN